MKTTSRRSTAAKTTRKPEPAKKKAAPLRTANLDKAIKDYEEALRLFAKKEFSRAANLFEEVIRDYPIEREVCDRSRIYLRVCKARTATVTVKPKTAEEFYLHGVVASNEGRLEDAADFFDKMVKVDSRSDKGYYALAAVFSLRNDRSGAIASLARAIELNPRNKVEALNDTDFDPLREDAEFMGLFGKPPEVGA